MEGVKADLLTATADLLPPRAVEGDIAVGANVNFIHEGGWDEPGLVNSTRAMLGGGGLLRYPAGNAANYWDWRTGWCLEGYRGTEYPCKGLTPRPYTLEHLAMGLAATGAQSVLTLNVLTANVSEALEMLAAAVRLGGAHLGV
jgi:hypothetical protein